MVAIAGASARRSVPWGSIAALSIAGIILSLSTGSIRAPLPYPGVGRYVNPVPPGVLPWKPKPFEGPFALNTELSQATRLFEGQVHGSESVTVAPDGRLIMLDKFNTLYEAHANASDPSAYTINPKPLAHLGNGRPLGFHFDNQGDIIVCDSLKGLVKYHMSTGVVEILASHVSEDSPLDPSTPITYANDLDIARDGTIYFTSCTDIIPSLHRDGYWDTFRAWSLSLVQGLPQGRLMAYHPATRRTHVIAKGFYYANGVALSADESYLALVETDRTRVHKVYLMGEQAGSHEVLIDQLPGVPDGVDKAADGSFWVSLVAPIPPIAAVLKDPVVRLIYAWLPEGMRPKAKPWGAVIKVAPDGSVTKFLTDPTGQRVSFVSAVSEHDGQLFLGNLVGSYVSVLPVPAS